MVFHRVRRTVVRANKGLGLYGVCVCVLGLRCWVWALTVLPGMRIEITTKAFTKPSVILYVRVG